MHFENENHQDSIAVDVSFLLNTSKFLKLLVNNNI